MQHNPNEPTTRSSGAEGAGAAGGSGRTGAGQDRINADLGDTTGDRSASAFSDTSGTLGRESLGGGRGTMDKAASTAQEKMGEAKERMANFRTALADRLDRGAERLRQRAAKTSVTEMGAEAEERARNAGGKLASGMHDTAEWLRTADMQSIKSGIEQQARTKPGRTLLVALGLGYIVGRAIRGGGRRGY